MFHSKLSPTLLLRSTRSMRSCDELQGLLDEGAAEVAQAPGETRRAEAKAFAQHAVNTMQGQGCQTSLDS